MDYFIPLKASSMYHVFNHANGRENLFFDDFNNDYFLDRLRFHLWPVAEFYAYNLLGNHFHLVIKVHDEKTIATLSKRWCRLRDLPYRKLNVNQQFSNFFNGYTKGMNKYYCRRGSLFVKRFRRVEITDEYQLRHTIGYVHTNAEKHGLVNDFREWEFSSYALLLGEQETFINREYVLEQFGGRDEFERYHLDFFNKK